MGTDTQRSFSDSGRKWAFPGRTDALLQHMINKMIFEGTWLISAVVIVIRLRWLRGLDVLSLRLMRRG